jgi:hypothetical protein
LLNHKLALLINVPARPEINAGRSKSFGKVVRGEKVRCDHNVASHINEANVFDKSVSVIFAALRLEDSQTFTQIAEALESSWSHQILAIAINKGKIAVR